MEAINCCGTVDYVHDAAGNMVGGSANGGPGTSTQYVYFRGGLLAQYWNGQGLWFAHLNGLGSTQQFTDYTGGNKRATMFYPFGQPGPSGSGSGSYLQALWSGFEDGDFWATSEWQTDTRRYTPGASRWYTPDPIGKAAARLDFPQTWNMYTYVQNNPTTLTDPSGQCDWCQKLINWAAGDGFVPNSELASSTQNTPETNTRLKPPNDTQHSWDPSKPLPDDPSKLGPDWQRDPNHQSPNDERYVNDKTGDKLDWHEGQPGEMGNKGEDHWHWVPGGKKQDEHYSPGDTIKQYAPTAVGVGVALGVIESIIETVPIWLPVAIAF